MSQYLSPLRQSPDELYHSSHKYTAKKWINGKWRYFYGRTLGFEGEKYVKKAQANARQKANAMFDARQEQGKANTNFRKLALYANSHPSQRAALHKQIANSKKEVRSADKKVTNSKHAWYNAIDKANAEETYYKKSVGYKLKPISKHVNDVVKTGSEKVAIGKKKIAKWLQKLF